MQNERGPGGPGRRNVRASSIRRILSVDALRAGCRELARVEQPS